MPPIRYKRRRAADSDSDESFMPSHAHHRNRSEGPLRRSSRVPALPIRRRIIGSDEEDGSSTPEDEPKVVRYDYPVKIQEWSEDGQVILPTSPFAELPNVPEQAHMLQAIRQRFSKRSMTMSSCASCFRRSPRYETSSISWPDFIGKYGEYLEASETVKPHLPCVPQFMSKYQRHAYSKLVINWSAVQQRGSKISVSLCSTCRDDRGVGKAPLYAAVNGTWVGDVPPCLQGLTLGEEILIGGVFMRGLVIFLDGQGAPTHRQRSLKGHVISFPLHAASTFQALKDLPRTSQELADSVAVVYHAQSVAGEPPSMEALTRQALRERYSSSLQQLVYVRRSRVCAALEWLKENNELYKDINIVQENLDTLPDCDVPETVWSTSFQRVEEDTAFGLDRRTDVLYSYVRSRRAVAPSLVSAPEIYVPGSGAPEHGGQPAVVDGEHGNLEGSRYDNGGDTDVDDGEIDRGIVTTGLVDLCANGMTAAAMQRAVLRRFATLRPGVGSVPLSEFDNLGKLIALAYPVLFPYGVGAPGSMATLSRGKRINIHQHGGLLMQHIDSRFERHRLFLFAVVNMVQRHAACRAAKAVVKHRDLPALNAAIGEMNEDSFRVLEQRIASGVPVDQAMSDTHPALRRVVSKINIVGHAIPGSPHARRKLLPQLHSMILTLGPPALFVTINPCDFTSPILMNWITGDGDLDQREPMKGVVLERLKLVAEHPALAARYFHEVCLAFQDIVLGQANDGVGIFGKTAGYFGVTEAQGRGTLHCHYVVWLEGAGTSDGIQRAVEADDTSALRAKLVAFFDGIASSCLDLEPHIEENASIKAGYCMPPDLGVPISAEEEAAFISKLREDAEWVARESNMHKVGHTFTCFKGGRGVCRFGFPKDLTDTTTYTPENGLQGRRNAEYLNTFNPIIAAALRCNHDIKLIQSTVECKATLLYVTTYITKSELTTHALLPIVRSSMATVRAREEVAVADGQVPNGDRAIQTVRRSLMTLLGNQDLSGAQAAQLLMGYDIAYSSHKHLFVPYAAARAFLLRQAQPVDNGELSDADGSKGDSSEDEDSSADEHSDSGSDSEDSNVPIGVVGGAGSVGAQAVVDVGIVPDEAVVAPGDPAYPVVISGIEAGGSVSITAASLLMDYVNRPLAEPWNSMTLMNFCLVVNKERKDLMRADAEQPTVRSPGRVRVTRFELAPTHPQHRTHVVYLASEKHNRRVHHLIPQLGGATVPKRNVEDEMYCLSVLTLAVPWRSARCLIEPGQTWCSAYATWIGDQLKSKVDARLYNILCNIEQMHVLGESRNADLRNREERERQLMIAQRRHKRQRDAEDYTSEIRSIMDLTMNYDPAAVTNGGRDPLHDVTIGVEALRASTAELGVSSVSTASMLPVGIAAASAGHVSVIDEAHTRLNQLKKTTAAGDDLSTDHHEGSSTVGSGNPHVGRDTRRRLRVRPRQESPEEFADSRGLNLEQRASFLGYVRHAARNFLNPGEPAGIPAENFILTGEGGSGKTHTIQCIIDYFLKRGWNRYLRVAATTGAAAANLHRGASTIDSLLKLPFGKGRRNPDEPVPHGFAMSLADVYYIILDESSMMGCEMLELICAKTKSRQGTYDHPSGKVSFLFAGDPHQFQPIDGVSLSSRKLPESKIDRRTPPSERHKSVHVGAMVWLSITNVVVLKQNYRQSGSTVLQDMLARMRAGKLTNADCDVLEGRVLRNLPSLSEQELADTQFIVQRNQLRIALNNKLDRLDCRAAGKIGIVVRGDDVLAATQQPPSTQVQAWIDIYGKPSKVRHMQPETFYYVGQLVRFTHNLCPEVGIANGSLGKIVGVHLDPEEPNPPRDADGNMRPTLLPACILVKVDSLTTRLHPEFDIGVVPVKPMTATGVMQVKPGYAQESLTVHYGRTAFPLIPTRCITDFKSQGSSFSSVVVDLTYPTDAPRKDYALAVYVMLSRVRTLEGLRILRLFDRQKIQAPFPKHIRDEWERLSALSSVYIPTVLAHN